MRVSYRNRSKPRRVVITGIGAVAPSGIGKEAFWRGLREGKNCVDRISFFDASRHSSQIAAEIKLFRPEDYMSRKEVKRMSRSSHLAVAAAQLAVQDANLRLTKPIARRIGVIVGTGVAGTEYAEQDFYAIKEGGVKQMRPFAGIAGFGGALSSEVSRSLQVNGLSLTLSTGCTGATDAMGYAFNAIRSGFIDTVISGGSDACITPGILGAFCQMGAVSTHFNDTPQRASRPFNKDRDGFVIGEGAWLFVLESLDNALRRGARIYGELAGYGATCDAYHMSIPNPSGNYTAEAIRLAILDAKLAPEDIQYFSAYGNSTAANDSYETKVIKKVFGKHAYKLAISSTKSMLGHPIGAAGASSVAASLMAIYEGWLPPTINQEKPDPDCDLDYVPNFARPGKVTSAVCNTLAFGSKNSALVVTSFRSKKASSRRSTIKRVPDHHHLVIPKSSATVDSIIINSDIRHVFQIAERYPTFVRCFRETSILSRDEKTSQFQIRSTLLGFPIKWTGKGLKKPYSQIKFVQLEGVLRGMRATWFFESYPGTTRVTITTSFKLAVPMLRKLLEKILNLKVQKVTRSILSDLKSTAELTSEESA